MPLPGRGPSASEALLSKSKSGTMPTYATPFIDEKLRAEVEFFKQWGFLVVRADLHCIMPAGSHAASCQTNPAAHCGCPIAHTVSYLHLVQRVICAGSQVEDAITPEQVAQLSDALDAAYERTKDDKRSGGGAPNPDAKDHFIHNVLEEDPAAFGFLLDNPPVVLRMRAILGSAVQLHSATARYVSPGMPDQQWHRDGGFPVDVDSDYRFGQINCGYFLDELTPELGVSSFVAGDQHNYPHAIIFSVRLYELCRVMPCCGFRAAYDARPRLPPIPIPASCSRYARRPAAEVPRGDPRSRQAGAGGDV